MKVINRSLNDYEHLQEVADVLKKDLVLQDSIRNILYLENQALERLISSQEKKMDLTQRGYAEQLDYKDSLLKQYKKKSRKQAIGVGVGGTLLGLLLGVLLIR